MYKKCIFEIFIQFSDSTVFFQARGSLQNLEVLEFYIENLHTS